MHAGDITLGIIAGGRATRLGGRDKAWIVRDGLPQVLRLAQTFAQSCGSVLVSANRDTPRYLAHGLTALPDRVADLGPLGGLDALATSCTTPWLLTLPVDIVAVRVDVLQALHQAGGQGAVARDDEGLQPLVALYRVDTLRAALAVALAAQQYSVQLMQTNLQLPVQRLHGVRFGNLNTPADLQQAGCADAGREGR